MAEAEPNPRVIKVSAWAIISGYLAACFVVTFGWFLAIWLFHVVLQVTDLNFGMKAADLQMFEELLKLPFTMVPLGMIIFVYTFVVALPGFVVSRLVMILLGRGGSAIFAGMGALNGLMVAFVLYGSSTENISALIRNVGLLFTGIGALAGSAAFWTERRVADWGRVTRRQVIPSEPGP